MKPKQKIAPFKSLYGFLFSTEYKTQLLRGLPGKQLRNYLKDTIYCYVHLFNFFSEC